MFHLTAGDVIAGQAEQLGGWAATRYAEVSPKMHLSVVWSPGPSQQGQQGSFPRAWPGEHREKAYY